MVTLLGARPLCLHEHSTPGPLCLSQDLAHRELLALTQPDGGSWPCHHTNTARQADPDSRQHSPLHTPFHTNTRLGLTLHTPYSQSQSHSTATWPHTGNTPWGSSHSPQTQSTGRASSVEQERWWADHRGSSPRRMRCHARRMSPTGQSWLWPEPALDSTSGSPPPSPSTGCQTRTSQIHQEDSHLDVRELAQLRVHGQQRLVHQFLVVVHPQQVIVLK